MMRWPMPRIGMRNGLQQGVTGLESLGSVGLVFDRYTREMFYCQRCRGDLGMAAATSRGQSSVVPYGLARGWSAGPRHWFTTSGECLPSVCSVMSHQTKNICCSSFVTWIGFISADASFRRATCRALSRLLNCRPYLRVQRYAKPLAK